MKTKFLSFFIVAALFLSSCTSEKQPKYIFYFIGDGFGISQAMIAEDYLDAIAKDTATVHLEFMKMPVLGMATTYSANSMVTCSSASGTALSAGVKTNNGMLGVKPDTSEVISIAKKLHDEGYNIGIISTVGLDHATPGAFYAHSAKRSDYNSIAKQLAETGYEFFGGGSLIASAKNPEIWNYVKEKGYTVSNDPKVIENHKLSDGKLYAISSQIAGSQDIPYFIDAPKHNMHLPYFVDKMIKLFEPSEKGFFAMIEAGKIDWSSHGNDAATTVHEVIQLDEAYKLAYEFYLRHPNETLILMTADHETGGAAVGNHNLSYKFHGEVLKEQKVSQDKFNGIVDKLAKDNASLKDVYKAIEENFGFNNGNPLLALNEKDSLRIELMYKQKFQGKNKFRSDKLKAYDLGDRSTLASVCIMIMNEKSGAGWTTGHHTGVSVPVRTIGVGSEQFNGFMNNIDIPTRMYHLTGHTGSIN